MPRRKRCWEAIRRGGKSGIGRGKVPRWPNMILSLLTRPYGIYDLKANTGFVNVGTSHETGRFAVAFIRAWWEAEGKASYPRAKYLQILADGGGSNGSRRRQWKYELYGLSKEIGIPIKACHYPPGTSKWNKIEHCLFPFVSMNWRGVPLTDYQTVVDLISNTTTREGLSVTCVLDTNNYELGVRISDEQMREIKFLGDKFHKNWNYTLNPLVNKM
jgi:hypothetical protein